MRKKNNYFRKIFRSVFSKNTDLFFTWKNSRSVFNENTDLVLTKKNSKYVFNENTYLIFIFIFKNVLVIISRFWNQRKN